MHCLGSWDPICCQLLGGRQGEVMPIAANSQPCAVQPDSCLFPSACLRNHDWESAKSGEDGTEEQLDPLRQMGEAGRGIGATSRFVVTSAVSLLCPALSPPAFSSFPSPITAAALAFFPSSLPPPGASPPNPFQLPQPHHEWGCRSFPAAASPHSLPAAAANPTQAKPPGSRNSEPRQRQTHHHCVR